MIIITLGTVTKKKVDEIRVVVRKDCSALEVAFVVTKRIKPKKTRMARYELSPKVNFTNILQAAFVPNSFRQKNYKSKL